MKNAKENAENEGRLLKKLTTKDRWIIYNETAREWIKVLIGDKKECLLKWFENNKCIECEGI